MQALQWRLYSGDYLNKVWSFHKTLVHVSRYLVRLALRSSLPPSIWIDIFDIRDINMENKLTFRRVTSIVLNGGMGFGFLIAVLFSMGDLYVALGSRTGFPIIEIVYGATGSKLATSLMMSGIIFSAITSTWANLAAASRTTWAFSRDNGLPFSSFFARVRTQCRFQTLTSSY